MTEDERILMLARIGREKVIKFGTYDMREARQIYQEHPFYVRPEDIEPKSEGMIEEDVVNSMPEAGSPAEEAVPMSDEDLANQIISANFKTGMSQAEVDDFLKTLIG